MLTRREAEIAALKSAGPLNVQQVADRIAELGLHDLTGRTPEATVAAQLYLAIQINDQQWIRSAPACTGTPAVDANR
jgi:hypothetical protein